MKLLTSVIAGGLCLSAFCLWEDVWSAPDPIEKAREAGEIWGKVDYCGPEGAIGIVAYIPGLSKVAYLDGAGSFELNLVAPGTYTIVFSRQGKSIHTLPNVPVERRSLTDLREPPIYICPDYDGDGFTPQEGDCNDFKAQVYPGAPELCGDGIDNNCADGADESCPSCQDIDADGFYAQIGCGIVDCDDSDPSVNPGATESCDGVDNDCDSVVDEADASDATSFYPDLDEDGTGDTTAPFVACTAPDGYISVGGDCDDSDPTIGPFAVERCGDGIDNDCNGLVDSQEECVDTSCTALERATYQTCVAGCVGPDLNCFLDCAEAEGISGACSEAIAQLGLCTVLQCDEEVQSGDELAGQMCAYNNCYEQYVDVFGDTNPSQCTSGETRPCGDSSVGQCQMGTQTCSSGLWGACEGAVGPSEEFCDEIDNDCDGEVDEFCSTPPDSCPACPIGTLCHEGQCIDTETDPQNCGGIGQACEANESCIAGVCAVP